MNRTNCQMIVLMLGYEDVLMLGYEDVDRNMFFKLKEGSRTR